MRIVKMNFSFKNPAERQQLQNMLQDSRFKILKVKVEEKNGSEYGHLYVTAELPGY